MTAISAEDRLQALQNPLYVFDQKAVLIGGIIQTSSLLFIIAISFVKPRGKRATKTQKQASET